MLTEGGLIKILDFGLARRLNLDAGRFRSIAPSQRARPCLRRAPRIPRAAARSPTWRRSSSSPGSRRVQSDIFALGLILYELATGRHPFHRPDAPEFQTIRAIQYAEPTPLREINPALPVELESVIFRCLEKQPSARFASAADVREALKTIMMAMHLDSVGMPGEAITLLPSQRPPSLETPEEEKRTTGILSMLAERFRESGTATQPDRRTPSWCCRSSTSERGRPAVGHAGAIAALWLCAGRRDCRAAGAHAVAGRAAIVARWCRCRRSSLIRWPSGAS